MKTPIFILVLLTFYTFSFAQIRRNTKRNTSIPIKTKWVKNLNGDFSFSNKWSYLENIFKNKFGQLICDGLCHLETEEMMDSNGRIKKDSIKAYYNIIDTSHKFHTLNSYAWCYEWAGTNFINIEQKENGEVFCETENNASTHSSLVLNIIGDTCFALINLQSIIKGKSAKYFCKSGTIHIDKTLWDKDIFKARFNLIFEHLENPRKPMYWKGEIYTKINKE